MCLEGSAPTQCPLNTGPHISSPVIRAAKSSKNCLRGLLLQLCRHPNWPSSSARFNSPSVTRTCRDRGMEAGQLNQLKDEQLKPDTLDSEASRVT